MLRIPALAALLLLFTACGGSGTSPAPPVNILLEVLVPGDTPDSARVALVASCPEPCDETVLLLDPAADGHWRGTTEARRGDRLTFRPRLLSPEAEEWDRVFEPVPPRELTAAHDETLSIVVERWNYALAPGRGSVRFLIDVPLSTPVGDRVGVSGNQSELGSWDGLGVVAEPRADGRHVTVVGFPMNTELKFKVTRGSWDTVEKGAFGEEISDRMHRVAGRDTVEISVASWRDQGGGGVSTLTGDIRFHRSVTSRFLTPARDVAVYLPPGYDGDTANRYPVLYMHDGQNIFDAATSFLGIEWGVDETAERLITEGAIPPMIIVGVYNTGDRVSEYTPVSQPGRGGGNADNYGRFLVEELKPFIDATYRTRAEREFTGIAGSSLGGLVSMYLGTDLSDTFSALGVVSPSVWWGDYFIVGFVEEHPKADSRIWVDIGTSEGRSVDDSQRIVEDTRMLRDALIEKGWVLGEDLHHFEDPGAPHNEAAWAGRVEAILRFLFPVND